jgi:hypothetical protein
MIVHATEHSVGSASRPIAIRTSRATTQVTSAGFTPLSTALGSGSRPLTDGAVSGRRHRPLGHFSLVRSERRKDLILLTHRDVEVIQRASQLGRDLIELLG